MTSSVPLVPLRQPNHAPPIKALKDSRFVLSKTPKRLIFFIHGFGGKNTVTWMSFPFLMLDDPHHASDDLLFYGYDSLNQPARASAGLLYKECVELFAGGQYSTADGVYERSGAHDYDKILFVAHSLGAPVVRCMLNSAHAVTAPWLHKVAVLFFAPATAGARAESLIREFAGDEQGGFFSRLFTLTRSRCPVIDDLKIGSPFLQDVCAETARLITHEGRQNFRSVRTVFGTQDRVIDLQHKPLVFDAPYDWLADLDHVMICKPASVADECYECFASAVGGLR